MSRYVVGMGWRTSDAGEDVVARAAQQALAEDDGVIAGDGRVDEPGEPGHGCGGSLTRAKAQLDIWFGGITDTTMAPLTGDLNGVRRRRLSGDGRLEE